MRKPVESPTYEFEAVFDDEETHPATGEITYAFHAVSPIRKVEP